MEFSWKIFHLAPAPRRYNGLFKWSGVTKCCASFGADWKSPLATQKSGVWQWCLSGFRPWVVFTALRCTSLLSCTASCTASYQNRYGKAGSANTAAEIGRWEDLEVVGSLVVYHKGNKVFKIRNEESWCDVPLEIHIFNKYIMFSPFVRFSFFRFEVFSIFGIQTVQQRRLDALVLLCLLIFSRFFLGSLSKISATPAFCVSARVGWFRAIYNVEGGYSWFLQSCADLQLWLACWFSAAASAQS